MRLTGSGKTFILFCIGIFALFFFSSCACLKKDNRRLLNLMDSGIHPESTASRVALAPPAMTFGTAALAADMALVHPAWMIPEAAKDIYNVYWKPRDMDMVRKVLLYVPCAILTPPSFVGDWLMLSLFDS